MTTYMTTNLQPTCFGHPLHTCLTSSPNVCCISCFRRRCTYCMELTVYKTFDLLTALLLLSVDINLNCLQLLTPFRTVQFAIAALRFVFFSRQCDLYILLVSSLVSLLVIAHIATVAYRNIYLLKYITEVP